METKLVNKNNDARWPQETTVGVLIAYARKRLGSRYLGVTKATYGGGIQVEVRSMVDGYHGRRMKREACYEIA
jgi:hypothetical protein